MNIWHAVVLALVQGLTEFLPISSSAHLILVPVVLAWEDQGLAFDVAVHVGTLVAVVIYFRGELRALARAWIQSLATGKHTPDSRLAWGVILGTVPVGAAAWVWGDFVETTLRSPMVIAGASVGFGLLLWWADLAGRRSRDEHSLSWFDIAVIGAAQALALIPGTSRSGITMTAALALGLTRKGAARFSFLLAVPVIALAGADKAVALAARDQPTEWWPLAVGVVVAGASAYLCIRVFLATLEKIGMLPFVVYRIALGLLIVGLEVTV